MRFHDEPLITLVRHLREELASGASTVVIEVPDPDPNRGCYPGESVDGLKHRPFRAWCDLAEALGCRLLTPRAIPPGHIELRFERLGGEAEWHSDGRGRTEDVREERYGAGSSFARFHKLEDPGFLLPYLEALGRIPLSAGERVLDLGVNRGDELRAFDWLPNAPELSFVGIDHSASAIDEARRCFREPRYTFLKADLNALPEDLGQFGLVISIGTLQSPGVDDRALLRRLVQRHLTPNGSLLLGFPNSRLRDGEVVYGARIRNLREADLSLVVKDLSFYRRYLHQHGFRTFLGGKYDLLLTAIRSSGERESTS